MKVYINTFSILVVVSTVIGNASSTSGAPVGAPAPTSSAIVNEEDNDHHSATPPPTAFTQSREEYNDSNNRKQRQLYCSSSKISPAWHPVYAAGWTSGYCRYNIDCDSPSYSSELDCCKKAYAGQVSGYCVASLPSPPTTSPTDAGGLDIWYPDYGTSWFEAGCINTAPMPSGRPTYTNMLACCKAAYAGQVSGKCISMLPNPPTTAPTNSAQTADFWYPQYELSWDQAGCSNQLPLPYKYINDRPKYSTQESCCVSAYRGQVSLACICGLPNPGLGCPGIIEYTVTTTTASVTSTLILGDITIPSDVTEKAALVESLEATFAALVSASVGTDAGTLVELRVISIGGVPVRLRRLLDHRHLSCDCTTTPQSSLSRSLTSDVTIEFETIVKTVCSEDCEGSNTISRATYTQVKTGLCDTSSVQAALQGSGNTILQSATVQCVSVNPDVGVTSQTTTTIGPPPTPPPTPRPTSPLPTTPQPTTPLPTQPPTAPPTSSPTGDSATDEPSQHPSAMSHDPSQQPSFMPSNLDVITEEWMFHGNGVSFPSETEVVLQSSSYASDQLGAVVTTHAFNEGDVDFQVDVTQTSFAEVQGGYESQLYIFFAEEGTYPETLLQSDIDIDEFLAETVGYLKSKVFIGESSRNTWFSCGTAETTQSLSTSTQYYELSLRLRKLNNQIHAYYKPPDGNAWIDIRDPMNIPSSMHDVPIQFGFRVKKEWQAYHNFSVRTTKLAGGPPLPIPTYAPTSSPTKVPTASPMLGNGPVHVNQLMFGGNGVSFSSDTEVVLQSESSANDQFGAVITTHAFNEDDVDFQVDFTQTSVFEPAVEVNGWYESQLCIFFAEAGTYPETLLQPENTIGDFLAETVGYLRSKVFTTMENTWFYSGTAETSEQSTLTNTQYYELSLRIRRLDNFIHTYYKAPGSSSTWIDLQGPMSIPSSMHSVPIQFGFRVMKSYRDYHNFSVRTIKLAGGPSLPIPTKSPTTSPTETRTYITKGTNSKETVCASTLDRSSVSSYEYEVRGIGGGGAMSGLSITPWDNDLWFVGTDMGTLFRSTDAGTIWYPVSHYEAKYHSRLIVSAPVGYTSNPSIVVHAACHEKILEQNCVAQRSVDSGGTWAPIDVTGGIRQDSDGNTVLDEIPMSWYGSLTQGSGIVYCTVFGSGNVYKSPDDGASWSRLDLPFDTTKKSTGLYFDESSATAYLYLATSHGIYMWKEGFEGDARVIYASDGTILLQSFTGARSSTSLMLSFVDNDVTACDGVIDKECGYVHTLHQTLNAATAESYDSFTFTKTSLAGFRVASSRTDSSTLWVTGARSWPSATGTQVWVGSYDNGQSSFGFTLKFRQYPSWASNELDYSGVGIDVGYWDGGYYRWNVKPNDSQVAGGTGNFFLHVTRNGGDHWESPFTEYADGCNTNGERIGGRRWRSTGLEMTSVRWLKFNPHNLRYAYASVADIRMIRSDDGGNTFEITGGDNTDPIFILNTVYDYDFADVHTIFAVGGNFHDWPHGWYKNLRRGSGGVFVSFNSGDNWHRVGALASSNCDDEFFNVDCSLGDDMRRQILSVHWDETVGGGTLYVGTQSAGVARLEGLNDIGTIEEMQALQWEWINNGLGTENGRIIPEIKERNGSLYCLLTGNAPHYTNSDDVGVYLFDQASSSWSMKKVTVNRHPDIGASNGLWAYPTSFDVCANGNLWLVDMETNGNYLASGIWKSVNGDTWDRVHQFTFAYHITCVSDRVYASGARSISHIGKAGWGDGGAMHSDDGGDTWQKNEAMPLLSNLNSVVIDPSDETKVFYTFFGGGMMHGPRP